jgi:hypothetical protein
MAFKAAISWESDWEEAEYTFEGQRRTKQRMKKEMLRVMGTP